MPVFPFGLTIFYGYGILVFMSDKPLDYEAIQKKIGYEFRNRKLLRQAFVRRSYTNEHGGRNNEQLELYGDAVVEVLSRKFLSVRFGKVENGEYRADCAEGELTELKKRLVEQSTLSGRIDALGLAEFLILGKGDLKSGIKDKPSVKEDLFEAIMGAVAIDSDWDLTTLERVFAHMHDLNGYLSREKESRAVLVQEWCQKKYGTLPTYEYSQENGDFTAALILRGCGPFVGFGASKGKARESAATAAYAYLRENGLL